MSYAIPTNELSRADIKRFKEISLAAGIQRAIDLGIARNPEEMVWREALPSTDFGILAAAGTGWLLEYYTTLAAVGAGVWALVFDTGPPAVAADLPDNRIAVFYKIADASAAPVVTGVRFRQGVTGATTKASFFIQPFIDIKEEPEVWLSEPVIFSPRDRLFIEFFGRVATPAGGEELSFGALVIERLGGTVS